MLILSNLQFFGVEDGLGQEPDLDTQLPGKLPVVLGFVRRATILEQHDASAASVRTDHPQERLVHLLANVAVATVKRRRLAQNGLIQHQDHRPQALEKPLFKHPLS